MMVGTVTADDEAVLPVTVVGISESREMRVEAVVDTGFTGHLSLRPEAVERLALPVVGSGRVRSRRWQHHDRGCLPR